MKNYKYLNMKGTSLEENQLEKYLKQCAEEHIISKYSDKSTYPIPKLEENLRKITKTYEILNNHLKLGIKINSAGEWILDNFYIIEETARNIEKQINKKAYTHLPGIANGKYKGFSRVYLFASEIVEFGDEILSEEKIIKAIKSYQTRKLLSMKENWYIGTFIQIALIQKIADICDKIYNSQIQKYKVEDIYERLIENKKRKDRKFAKKIKYNANNTELNRSYIEYLVYKLRRSGIGGEAYLEILKKEVNKIGLDLDDVVKKEHLYTADLKIKIGLHITNIKRVSRINFKEIFKRTNKIEEILEKDPSNIYEIQTEDTKELYREKIRKLSNRYNLSEIYITEEIIKLAEKYKSTKEDKRAHVGYYLIDDGIYELREKITEKKNSKISKRAISKIYTQTILILPIILELSILLNVKLKEKYKILFFILLYIPIMKVVKETINFILKIVVKENKIPKLNFEDGIPDYAKTMIVIPCILNSETKVKELMRKMEIYHKANEDKNLFFTLLGDCTTSEKEVEKEDKKIIECGEKEAQKLNDKYNTKNKFNFIYRKRIWNPNEHYFMGWERKRGILLELNEYLLGKKENTFIKNTLENFEEKIKYIITLDSDTNLVLDSAQKMIGAMSHILNKPVERNGKIIDGYSIMQPRIGISLEDYQKTLHTKIYSSTPGIDFYTNTVPEVYQDCFKEGIYTGKGIYDLEIYQKIMKDKFPENKILSHDLIEGNFLRCGFLSDVVLLDSFPKQYLANLEREKRWTRGDWQIADYTSDKNITNISKFKILDNILRSLWPVSNLAILILSISFYNMPLFLFSIFSLYFNSILEIIDKIIFRKTTTKKNIHADKIFQKNISGIKGSILRNSLDIVFLPTKSYYLTFSIVQSLYRLKVNKKLLEWKTAEKIEKDTQNSLEYYCKKMISNILSGILMFGILNPICAILGTLWIFGPYIAWKISQNIDETEKISEDNIRYLKDLSEETWKYFYDTFKAENNYLVPDNYQLGRKEKWVNRTSSTNIGLEILSIISASDLNFITKQESIEMIKKVLSTIKKLEKWNGHLYNWYNIKTLKPLSPEYVSTVDSGNFVGYLYVLKSFFIENNVETKTIKQVEKMIENTDFNKLYSHKNRLFSIGYDKKNNKLNESYYDFLASEARQASFIAIAKKDIKYKHWSSLSRTLTSIHGYKGLISWAGTSFEYTMPNIIMKIPKGSLIDESCRFMLESQKIYAKKQDIPWGISESAYSIKDLHGNYQYKAFGIPWLGLKRGLEDELVVSPYASIMLLAYDAENVIRNLKKIETYEMKGKYGFFDSIDFTQERINSGKKYEPVKTYMAHHQGLILNTINNVINFDILKKRFLDNVEIEAIQVLLDEKMPESIVLNKERKQVIKGKYENRYSDKEIVYLPSDTFKRYNILANENYASILDSNGVGSSKYNGIQINRFKTKIEGNDGIQIYFKNTKNNQIFNLENSITKFMQYKSEVIKKEKNIKVELQNYLVPNEPTEIKKIKITNNDAKQIELETFLFFEPILSRLEEDEAHPSYNNMFIKFEYLENQDILICKRKRRDKEIYLGIKVISNDNKFEFEIDKEKFWGRNSGPPIGIKNNNIWTSKIKQTVEPIIAIKVKTKIKPQENTKIYFAMNISETRENVEKNLEQISKERCESTLELAKAKSEEEIKFLELSGEEIENSQKIVGHLIEKDLPKKIYQTCNIEDIWKFGISGTNPIILVRIKNTEEIYVIEELLEVIEYLNIKQFRVDLIILNNENISYDTLLKNEINDKITKYRLEYLINNQIFIINKQQITNEDSENLKSISDIKISASLGSLKNNLRELEKNQKERKDDEYVLNIAKEDFTKEELEYWNGYGGFSDNEYIIKIKEGKFPPRVWCNIIANKSIGTVVTETQSGYTWLENSRLKRITNWENDSIKDYKNEKITIKDLKQKEKWEIAEKNSDTTYKVIYGLGYAKYKQINNDIIQENTIFIPLEDTCKINMLKLINKSNESKELIINYELNLALGENKHESYGRIKYEKIDNKIILENICKINFPTSIELSSNYKIQEYKIGNQAINTGNIILGNKISIEIKIVLKPYETNTVIFNYGKEIDKYTDVEECENELEEIKKYWEEKTEKIKIDTPSKILNLYMNKWLIYQTITSRLIAKTGFYQSGGATGFRDQLQDGLGMKWIDEKILYNQILECAKHQFKEGDCMHWWHESNKTGIRTKISDDLLWLPYATLEYIEFTGEKEILNEKIEYTDGIKLDGEKEKYSKYYYTDEKESLYMHCLKAINKSLDFGKNGLPKIGTGDWNDGFDKVGEKGEGESIWLGFFLYNILEKWDKIIEKRFEKMRKKLKENLDKIAWDGNWYKRAISDDEKVLGSHENEECKIDSISQSWAIISNYSNQIHGKKAIESVEKYLVDKENGIIKLLTPGFNGKTINPGYIQDYPEGVRENGGQYTHGSIWHILALCKLGDIDQALEYAEMINPINHTLDSNKVEKYKIEPYVLPGDIYSNDDMPGRGGWSWYTGSSSWYYKVVLEEIIGLKRQGNKLYLPKRIPEKWKEFEIQYKYKNSIYNIKLTKNNKKKETICNGEKIDVDWVELNDEKTIKNVEIKM